MSLPLVSMEPVVQAFYEDMRRKGQSHSMADMLAHRRAPGLMTDSVFLEGHCNGRQFQDSPMIGDFYRKKALEAGVNPHGKVYLSGLASHPGDPEAWVSGRGDVKRICEKRNWNVSGAVHHSAHEALDPPKPGPAVAEDIVERETQVEIAKDPSKGVRIEDTKESVRNRLKPHWAK